MTALENVAVPGAISGNDTTALALKALERVGTPKGTPTRPVTIVACGEVPVAGAPTVGRFTWHLRLAAGEAPEKFLADEVIGVAVAAPELARVLVLEGSNKVGKKIFMSVENYFIKVFMRTVILRFLKIIMKMDK